MGTVEHHSGARLSELVAALSIGTDLGLGAPMEHVMRQCLVALGIGERLGLDDSERAVVYYVALLAWVGCHADSYEQARWFGDDMTIRADTHGADLAGMRAAWFALSHVGNGSPALRRTGTALRFLASGRAEAERMTETHCLMAGELAQRLGLGAPVRDALLQVFERWDGKGEPARLAGSAIVLPARLVQLADVVARFHRLAGPDVAVAVARERSRTQFDPELVDRFCRDADEILAPLDAATSWDAVIEAEPGLGERLSEEELDAALEAIANFVDLKSPYTLGHSLGVSVLAADAARLYGLGADDVLMLRRAALVHDLGRMGISNAIWDKRGELTAAELERVRLHPYLTERILSASPTLAPLGALAAQHHERLDGSGYPRGIRGHVLAPAARILAAADVYHAMTEPRPHRPARDQEAAAAELRSEVRAGRLDAEAVDAVLRAAGHLVGRRREGPAGLTPREIEVLVLLARGLTNKEIADRLIISTKTVRNHVEHVYTKIGVSSRAAAGLFATEHGLLGDLGGAKMGQLPHDAPAAGR